MSKRKARQSKSNAAVPLSSRKRKVTRIITLLLCLSLAGAIFAQWRAGRLLNSRYPVLAPTPTVPPPSSPSKEYIYAGGRLVATEEPNQGTASWQAALVATVGSAATQVNLTWNVPTTLVHHYRVERAEAAGSFTTSFDSPTNSYTDAAASNKAYLYRVCGVDAAGTQQTPYSNIDLATTFIFTDDPLIAKVTTVKAQHLTELRQAVNAVRLAAGLAAASWTDPSPAGVWIKAAHIQELRANLDAALSALGIAITAYTDPTLSSAIAVKAVHFQELRARLK